MGEAAKHVAYQREQRLLMDETIAQRDLAMGLAAEASASAAEAATRALAAAARAKEAEASASYQSRLRIKAEEMAEHHARRCAASEAELEELRRKMAEMQSTFGSPWVNRKVTPRQL